MPLLGTIKMVNLGTMKISKEVPVGDIPGNTASCRPNNCEGRVWIFYASYNQQEQWGTINSQGVGQSERDVMCRQLGYIRASITENKVPQLTNNSVPVWLTDINCGTNNEQSRMLNIFQCKYLLCSEGKPCYDHTKDLVLNCGEYS